MSPELQTAIKWIHDIAVWMALIPFSIGVIMWRKSPNALKYITLLMVIGFSVDMVTYFYRDKASFSLYMPRVYTLIEFTLISLFFINITQRKSIRWILFLIPIPFIAIAIFDYVSGGLMQRDDLSVGIESFVFISLSILTLYNILRDAEFSNITATSQFWILSAILIYFGGNIFVFITSNYVHNLSNSLATFLWTLHSILCGIFYIILTVGLWKTKQYR